MDEKHIAEKLLSNFGLRIEPEMSRYVREQLQRSREGEFPVMGGHALTGVPLRQFIDAARLHQALQST